MSHKQALQMISRFSRLHRPLAFAFLLLCVTLPLQALESPTSDGSVSLVETPVVRIPLLKKPPKIDGNMGADEWNDAAGYTGFWQTIMRGEGDYNLAPKELQSRVYAGYDREHLYLLYRVRMYPEDGWLKARGRFPDVYNHPIYGIMRDDHIEFELRPYHDNRKGYAMGMFKWFVNPIGVVSDQYWSLEEGLGKRWQSQAEIRAGVESKWWQVEMKIPLKHLIHKKYAGKDELGRELVTLPPPDGTTYRFWTKNGISGFSTYVIRYDLCGWNQTSAKMIFDSKSVSFQINELGPVMEDIIDVTCTLKNHNTKSETVRMGFFMENADTLVFSSYDDSQTTKGLVELAPGESKRIRFRKKFPGISSKDNFLWFDVRTAGRPAKLIYQSRLSRFFSADNPPAEIAHWRDFKLENVKRMRPPKVDFEFNYQYSPYENRVSAMVDKGIHGASDEAKSAVEARLSFMRDDDDELVIAKKTVPFNGEFATFEMDLPELEKGDYKVLLLLFDKDKRIVGEREPKAFYKGEFAFEKNQLGKEDIVWTPYTPNQVEGQRLETLKHVFTLGPSGLPQQIHIKAHDKELPLEERNKNGKVSPRILESIGRGDQLRAPMRFEAVVQGERVQAKVVEAAKLVKKWKSESEFKSKLELAGLELDLLTRYDCDGAMSCDLQFTGGKAVKLESLELVMDVAGPVDHRVGGMWGMQPNSGLEMTLAEEEGIVWDSADHRHFEDIELFYTRFVPRFNFGNGDRAWSWICDSDEEWLIDREGSTMTLERDKDMQVTWRTKFINHKTTVNKKHQIAFCILTHPSKPKEEGYRRIQWLDPIPTNLEGDKMKCLPNDYPNSITSSDESIEHFKKLYPHGGPLLYMRSDIMNTGIPSMAKGSYSGEWTGDSSRVSVMKSIDSKGGYGQPWVKPGNTTRIHAGSPSLSDFYVYWLEKQVRKGKICGWWWDETPVPARTNVVANKTAYFRDPSKVKKGELPFQSKFGTLNLRNMLKRLARIQTKHGVPVRSSFWPGAASTFESLGDSSNLYESTILASSYEIDNITRFPVSFFRYAAQTFTGMYARIIPDIFGKGFGLRPGDETRFDRGFLGRCLTHDIGSSMQYPNMEQYHKVLNILHNFGYFESDVEFIPYWRSGKTLRYGEAVEDDAFSTHKENPFEKALVSVYRRPLPGVKGGYQALIIIMNENDEDLRGRLHILDNKSLFGGRNNCVGETIYRETSVPTALAMGPYSMMGRTRSLVDVERRGAVSHSAKVHGGSRAMLTKSEIYGPIHVPGHDFRILYGHYDPRAGQDDRKLAGYYKSIRERGGSERAMAKHGLGKLKKDKAWWTYWKELPRKFEKPKGVIPTE